MATSMEAIPESLEPNKTYRRKTSRGDWEEGFSLDKLIDGKVIIKKETDNPQKPRFIIVNESDFKEWNP